jgi:hypothetical protein
MSSSAVEEVVKTCDSICNRLDEIIAMDRRFCDEMLRGLEMANWEIMRQRDDLNNLIGRYGN